MAIPTALNCGQPIEDREKSARTPRHALVSGVTRWPRADQVDIRRITRRPSGSRGPAALGRSSTRSRTVHLSASLGFWMTTSATARKRVPPDSPFVTQSQFGFYGRSGPFDDLSQLGTEVDSGDRHAHRIGVVCPAAIWPQFMAARPPTQSADFEQSLVRWMAGWRQPRPPPGAGYRGDRSAPRRASGTGGRSGRA